jgi:hypothetical protein
MITSGNGGVAQLILNLFTIYDRWAQIQFGRAGEFSFQGSNYNMSDNQSTTVMIMTDLPQLDIMQPLKVKLYQNKYTLI